MTETCSFKIKYLHFHCNLAFFSMQNIYQSYDLDHAVERSNVNVNQ